MIRPLEKMFEPEKATKLRKMVERLKNCEYPPGVSRYYGLELAVCIEAGALLGALVMGSSLLELYVRSLVINYADLARRSYETRGQNLEGVLEENRNIGFSFMIDHLVSVELFNKKDGEKAKTLYKKIRIPLVHGLSKRFVSHHNNYPKLIQSLNIFGSSIKLRHLEEIIENHALEYLEDIIGLMERNRF